MRRKVLARDKLEEVLMLLDRGIPSDRLADRFNVPKPYMVEVRILRDIPGVEGKPMTIQGVQLQKAVAAATKSQRKYPEKHSARSKLNHEVRSGRMIRPDFCSECGQCGIIHGHHDDYSKPLDVRWLCFPHHREWHKKNPELLEAKQ